MSHPSRTAIHACLAALAAGIILAFSASCSADVASLATAINGGGSTKPVGGRVSLSVQIASSGTQTISGTTETKNELAQGNLVFDLPTIPGVAGGYHWENATFGGTASWSEEHITPSSVQIPGTVQYRPCTTVDSLVQSFSSAAAGPRPGDVELVLKDGGYELTISAGGLSPVNVLETTITDCNGAGKPTRTSNASNGGAIGFSEYFSSSTMGASGSRGVISRPMAAGATRINDVIEWTDQWQIFSYGATRVTVPVVVKLTWDFTMSS